MLNKKVFSRILFYSYVLHHATLKVSENRKQPAYFHLTFKFYYSVAVMNEAMDAHLTPGLITEATQFTLTNVMPLKAM